MSEFQMPCDTLYRIANAIPSPSPSLQPSWNTLRIDGDCVVASDRTFLVAEKFGIGGEGIFHIVPDPAMIAQCKIEAQHGGRITFTVNEMLGFAIAKTTFGWQTNTNLLYTGVVDEDWQKWRDIIKKATPADASRGAMYWNTDTITRIAESSPSGGVVFEENIDTSRPVLIRDITDYNWIGCFHPLPGASQQVGATIPSWIK